jgi:hypothetical protein
VRNRESDEEVDRLVRTHALMTGVPLEDEERTLVCVSSRGLTQNEAPSRNAYMLPSHHEYSWPGRDYIELVADDCIP